MQHLKAADKSLLVGDRIADALIRYAAQLGRTRSADDVSIRALAADGAEVTVHLLLNSGSNLVTETTAATLPEPDNDSVTEYIEQRLARFELPEG